MDTPATKGPSSLLTETCAAVLFTGTCGARATVNLTAMCVHEHERAASVCDEHARQWRNGYRPTCLECMSGPSPHPCTVSDKGSDHA